MPFSVAVIIVPDRGLPVSRLKEFFHPPVGVSVVFVEHRRTDDPFDMSPGDVSSALSSIAPDRKARIIADGVPLERGQLYILSSGTDIDIREDRFMAVHSTPTIPAPYLPDYFLCRMAAALGERLTVILADHTGMLGARSVRAEGGCVYVVAGPGQADDTLPMMDGAMEPGQFTRRFTAGRQSQPTSGQQPGSGHQPQLTPDHSSWRDDPATRGNGHALCEPRFTHLLEHEIFPLIWKNRRHNGPLRIWVAGVSSMDTGYSVAISLLQYLTQRKLNLRTQIFASQLDRQGVDRARTATFEEAALIDVPAPCRELYFVRKPNGAWKVARAIQQMCVFSMHHIVADPPYSRCDLIICGAPLDCLSDQDRGKLLRNIHYAVNPHGLLLFLPSGDRTEAARNDTGRNGKLTPLFDAVPNIAGLYTRIDQVEPALPIPVTPRPPSDAEREADRVLMTGYVPAAMLVDEHLRVIRFYGIMSPFLRRKMDRPTLHLLNIVRDELIFDLGDLLEQADKSRQPAAKDNICLSEEDGPEYRLEVIPILLDDQKNKLVIIKEKRRAASAETTGDFDAGGTTELHVKSLERQVQKLRYQLQSAHRVFKQTQEEMQLVNEEIIRSNEELQSMNKELQSINDDLQIRIRELEPSAEPVHR